MPIRLNKPYMHCVLDQWIQLCAFYTTFPISIAPVVKNVGLIYIYLCAQLGELVEIYRNDIFYPTVFKVCRAYPLPRTGYVAWVCSVYVRVVSDSVPLKTVIQPWLNDDSGTAILNGTQLFMSFMCVGLVASKTDTVTSPEVEETRHCAHTFVFKIVCRPKYMPRRNKYT